MRQASKVLMILAFISFLIILTLKIQNNIEMEQYFKEQEAEAKAKLTELELSANFVIPIYYIVTN